MVKVTLVEAGNELNVIETNVRKTLSSSDSSNVVIVTGELAVNHIIQVITDMEILVNNSVWLFVDVENSVPDCPICCQDNVYLIQGVEWKVYLDEMMTAIISAVDNIYWNRTVGQDQIVFNNIFIDEIKQAMSSIRRTVKVKQFIMDGAELYTLAEWDPDAGFYTSWRIEQPSTIPLLRVVTTAFEPYIFKKSENGKVMYSGYCIDILDKVSQMSNFKYVIKECGNTSGKYVTSELIWDKCVQDVQDGRADLIAAPLSVTKERESVVDFILPYLQHSGIQMLGRRKPVKRFDFFGIYDITVWSAIFVSALAISVFMCLVENIRWTHCKCCPQTCSCGTLFACLVDGVWFAVLSMAFESGITKLRYASTKVHVAGYWFLVSVMMAVFTAKTASFLTLYRWEAPLMSFADLADQSSTIYSTIENSSEMFYFQRMKEIEQNFDRLWIDFNLDPLIDHSEFEVWTYPLRTTFTRLWESMRSTGFMQSYEHAETMIQGGDFVLIGNSKIIEYLTQRDCSLEAKGSSVSQRPHGFALKKNSLFLKNISEAFSKLQQSATLEFIERRWWKEDKMECREGDINQDLDLYVLHLCFLFLFIGMLLGILAFLCELTFRRIYCRSKKYSFGSADYNDMNTQPLPRTNMNTS